MLKDKRKIQQNFNQASNSYDLVATVQKECAKKLIVELIKNFPHFQPSSILDLGTGTGYIPELLLPIFPKSTYTLNDIAPTMLEKAKEKLHAYKNLNFHLADIERSNFGFYPLIISNLALQWMNNLNNTLKKLYNHSDVFAFSCLLEGTFEEWANMFQSLPLPTYSYPSRQSLESYLLSLQPKERFFDVQEFSLTFTSLFAFIHYLKKLGAHTSHQKVSLASLRQLLQSYQNEFTITYKVFFGLLKR